MVYTSSGYFNWYPYDSWPIFPRKKKMFISAGIELLIDEESVITVAAGDEDADDDV